MTSATQSASRACLTTAAGSTSAEEPIRRSMSHRRRRQAPPSRRPPYRGTLLLFLFVGVATRLACGRFGAPARRRDTRLMWRRSLARARAPMWQRASSGRRRVSGATLRRVSDGVNPCTRARWSPDARQREGAVCRRAILAARRHHHVLPKRQPLRRPHRRPRWDAAGFRRRLHVRRRAVAAVPASVARRPLSGTGHLVGHAPGGSGRPAMVPACTARAASRR